MAGTGDEADLTVKASGMFGRRFFPYLETAQDSLDFDRVVRLTSLTYLVTLMMSWKLYVHGTRIFLETPVIPALTRLPHATGLPVLAAAMILLIVLILRPRTRRAAYGVTAIAVFWVLQDLMRLQPYVIMYVFTIFISAVARQLRHHGLSALRVMVSGVYFWAGFNKCNLTFVTQTFPWFMEPAVPLLQTLTGTSHIVSVIAMIVPIFELSIGILLLFPRWRKTASWMAFAMLAIVLLFLGPFGHNWNSIVWPWNIYLFALEYILFLKARPGEKPIRWELTSSLAIGMAIFVVAPALALFGWWPSYPAFRLYSGNIRSAAIVFAKDEPVQALPKDLATQINKDRLLLVPFWTFLEFKVAAYPEVSVFVHGSKGLCPYLQYPAEARLRLYDIAPFYSDQATYNDMPLCP